MARRYARLYTAAWPGSAAPIRTSVGIVPTFHSRIRWRVRGFQTAVSIRSPSNYSNAAVKGRNPNHTHARARAQTHTHTHREGPPPNQNTHGTSIARADPRRFDHYLTIRLLGHRLAARTPGADVGRESPRLRAVQGARAPARREGRGTAQSRRRPRGGPAAESTAAERLPPHPSAHAFLGAHGAPRPLFSAIGIDPLRTPHPTPADGPGLPVSLLSRSDFLSSAPRLDEVLVPLVPWLRL